MGTEDSRASIKPPVTHSRFRILTEPTVGQDALMGCTAFIRSWIRSAPLQKVIMIEGEREMRQKSKDTLSNMEEIAAFIKCFQIGKWNC